MIYDNREAVNSMHSIAVYEKSVVLKRIQVVISRVQDEYSSLLEIYSEQFFRVILKKLHSKKRIYNINLHALQETKKSLEEQELKRALSKEQLEYKNSLGTVIAAYESLIATLEIEMELLSENRGEKL